MNPNQVLMALVFRCIFTILFCSALSLDVVAQKDTSKWKAQFAVGLNRPFWSGFVDGLNSNDINAPTVNIGIQHMFMPQFGVKLDYGFNRFKNADDVPDFKINYSRINAQFVFDATENLPFLPLPMRVIGHAGPGYSVATPLALLGENKQSYLNGMAGLEIHYGISRTASVYINAAYVHGFTELDNYDPPIDGLGAFNGNLFYGTIGITVSLSGCYTCN